MIINSIDLTKIFSLLHNYLAIEFILYIVVLDIAVVIPKYFKHKKWMIITHANLMLFILMAGLINELILDPYFWKLKHKSKMVLLFFSFFRVGIFSLISIQLRKSFASQLN